jgi:hypothetical protein
MPKVIDWYMRTGKFMADSDACMETAGEEFGFSNEEARSSLNIAVDLQLSIKVLGTNGLRAADQVLYKTFDLRTAVCRPYNAKLLHCKLINPIPKSSLHILLPDLCPHLPSNVH